MGVRSFLKGKVDKHGGIAGLAVAVLSKPVRMASGGAGTRTGAPNSNDGTPEDRSLPTRPDADGFVAVATSDHVQVGRPREYEAHGHTIAVFRVGEKLYAIDNACLHEDGPLGEASQDGHIATCAYHNWRYDVRDGTCLSATDRRLGCYAVREKDGFIWLGKAVSRGSDDRGGEHDDGLKVV